MLGSNMWEYQDSTWNKSSAKEGSSPLACLVVFNVRVEAKYGDVSQ